MTKARGVRVQLKGVHKVQRKLADGTTRVHYYAWRGGPALDPENLRESYEQAHRQRKEREAAERSGTTIAARLCAYKAADQRSSAQKRNVAFAQEIIATAFGHFNVLALEDRRMRGDIIAERDKLAGTPRKADFFTQEITRFANWLFDRGEIGAHVVSRIKKLSQEDRSSIVWEASEIDAVMAELPNDNARRLFGFMLETGLDGCDVTRLTWAHVKAHSVEIARQKTGILACPPLSDEAKAILGSCDRSQLLVFPNSRGRAYSNFSGQFAKARKAAGITTKRLKDARGTACTRFCERISSDEEIADMMGWSVTSVRNIRKRYVDRDALARSRAERLGNTQL